MKLDFDLPVFFLTDVETTLVDVVIDPLTRTVSHLVVQPEHRSGLARLIPIADLEADEKKGCLRCSAELDTYPLVEDRQFVRMSTPIAVEDDWAVGIEHVSALPYYSADFGEFESLTNYGDEEDPEVGITFHRIPKGEVELRRSSEVVSADEKALGRLDGFVVADDHITHVVLERGHLWGRHEVAIPVSAVQSFSNDEVLLSLSKAEVETLPRPTSVVRP